METKYSEYKSNIVQVVTGTNFTGKLVSRLTKGFGNKITYSTLGDLSFQAQIQADNKEGRLSVFLQWKLLSNPKYPLFGTLIFESSPSGKYSISTNTINPSGLTEIEPQEVTQIGFPLGNKIDRVECNVIVLNDGVLVRFTILRRNV